MKITIDQTTGTIPVVNLVPLCRRTQIMFAIHYTWACKVISEASQRQMFAERFPLE